MNYSKMHFKDHLATRMERFKEMDQAYAQNKKKDGEILENLVEDLFHQYGYRIQRHSKEVDYLFGADFKLSWVEGEKHYSIHLDVTGGKKPHTRWIDYHGVVNRNSSCFYGGERFSAYFGLKLKHPTGIIYQSPVYVMRVENKWHKDLEVYRQEFLFAIENLKRIHMESDRPRRASMMIEVPEYLV